MKKFVRLLSALLILAMAVSLVACSNEEKEPEGTQAPSLNLGTNDPTADPTADPSDATEEPTAEPSATAAPTVDLSTYEAPTLEEPALEAFELPTTSAVSLKVVDPIATEDSTTVTVKAEDVYTGALILVNSQYKLKLDPADVLVKMYDHRAENAAEKLVQPLEKLNITAVTAPWSPSLPLPVRFHSDMNCRHLGVPSTLAAL